MGRRQAERTDRLVELFGGELVAFVECGVNRVELFFRETVGPQHGRHNRPRVDLHDDLLGAETDFAEEVDGDEDAFGVGEHVVFAEDIDVPLKELA